MFKNLSIGLKVAFIAIVGFVGILIFQSANYRLSVNLRDQLHKVFNEDFVLLKFSNDLQINFSDLDKLYQAALIEADIDTLTEADIKARAIRNDFIRFKQQHHLNKPVYNELVSAFNAYTQVTSRHTAQVLSGKLGYQQTLMGYDQIGLLKQDYEHAQTVFFDYCYSAFENQLAVIQSEGEFLVDFGLLLGILLTLILGIISFFVIRNLINAFHNVVNLSEEIANGNFNQNIAPRSNDETGKMMLSLRAMRDALKQQREDHINREHTRDFLSGLNVTMRGDPTLDELLAGILSYFSEQLDTSEGNIYLFNHKKLTKKSSFPQSPCVESHSTENVFLENIASQPEGNIYTPELTLDTQEAQIQHHQARLLLPIYHDGVSLGIIELFRPTHFIDQDLELISKCQGAVFIAIDAANSRAALAKMLEQTQKQAKVLKKQRQELEISGRYKSQFLSTMSHELRTPLNSILILSETLMNNRSGALSAQEVQNAQIIHTAGSDLLALINDILDLSKIEEGKMEVVWEKFDIRELAESIYHAFALQAKNKQLEYQVVVDKDVPILICSDSIRLKQILKNFISNALKFTDSGGVFVNMTIKPETPSTQKELIITVKDTGVGIEHTRQQDVFEAFKQLDGTTSRKYGGTGLGLSISRELSKLLKGQVGLYSEGPNKGSSFTLSLPLDPQVAAPEVLPLQKMPRIEQIELTGFSKQLLMSKVLIVEDNPVLIQTMRSVFNKHKVPSVVASTGKEALATLQKEYFSCLIVDLNLPDYPSDKLFPAIRGIKDYKDTPLIVFTAEDLSETEKKALHQYADYVIVKTPKAIQEVCLLTKSILANQFNDHSQGEKTSYHFQGKHLLLVDDDDRNLYSLSMVLENSGLKVSLAHSGKDALKKVKEDSSIDIIVLDIMMPIMDGYEVMNALQSLNSPLPIIALTAKAMIGDKEKCLNAGASQYLSKPVESNHLLQAIAQELA